jgi:predicted MarR family transcription regulator
MVEADGPPTEAAPKDKDKEGEAKEEADKDDPASPPLTEEEWAAKEVKEAEEEWNQECDAAVEKFEAGEANAINKCHRLVDVTVMKFEAAVMEGEAKCKGRVDCWDV